LKQADIRFGQNERHYTDRFTEERDLLPGVSFTEIAPAKHAAALKLAGYDVMSFASNHCMDMGADAMLDTVRVLKENGVAVIGVGRNIEEARRPAIIERKGTKVAFLAYASVIRPGWEATSDKPGCAPLRAWTLYQQTDYQPATPPTIRSFVYREDLEAMRDDIRKVRPKADVVVVSVHWGVHFAPAVLAMYQREAAREAIDTGADIILGHHPHILKGIEVYKGKVIVYSMGNFAMDTCLIHRKEWRQWAPGRASWRGLYPLKVEPEYMECYSLPAEQRKSMIVRCTISGKRIQGVSYLPVLINAKAQPAVVPPGDPEFEDALRYMEDISASQELGTSFSVRGGEIVIGT
ncbi:MAG: CapA family protein, partial [Chloroflexota bacterium]